MKISIHMPAYNAEATIASALRSLIRQRGAAELEIIVVDDGSTDRTREIVATLAATAPEVRLVRTAHGGVSKARNAALGAMSPDADLVGFLDADDLLPEDRLARDVEAFETDPDLDLIYCGIRYFDDEDTERLQPSARSNVVDARNMNLAAGLFRRRLIDRIGRFDETLPQSEDLDFVLRIFEGRPKYSLCDRIGLYYRKNHGGISECREEARRQMVRAYFRAHKRGAKPYLPEGVVTTATDRVATVPGGDG